jgi:hypothetical protein
VTYLLYSARVGNYDIFICNDSVMVTNSSEIVTCQFVEHIQDFVTTAEDLHLSWAKLPDFEVIYLYDQAENNFGYAVNLQDRNLSDWVYAPSAGRGCILMSVSVFAKGYVHSIDFEDVEAIDVSDIWSNEEDAENHAEFTRVIQVRTTDGNYNICFKSEDKNSLTLTPIL